MGKRAYHQYCGLARALDVIGERWTLLIVRNLLLGPRRYTELLRGLPGITTNLLADRLGALEIDGVVEKIREAPNAPRHRYRLTPLGRGLEPAIHALGAWGGRWMEGPLDEDATSLEWYLVALRRRYRGGTRLRGELVADGVPYAVSLEGDRAELSRGPAPGAEVRVRGSEASVLAWLRGAPAAADLEVDGPEEAADRLRNAFADRDPSPPTSA